MEKDFENMFRLAEVLQIQEHYEEALEKYRQVCYDVARHLKEEDPEIDSYWIPTCLEKMAEIYRLTKQFRVVPEFMNLIRKFNDELNPERQTLQNLLVEMETLLNKTKWTEKSPEEIMELLKKAKTDDARIEERENIEKLRRYIEGRKLRAKESRFARYLFWCEDNPGIVIAIALTVVGLFMTFWLSKYFRKPRVFTPIRKPLDESYYRKIYEDELRRQ